MRYFFRFLKISFFIFTICSCKDGREKLGNEVYNKIENFRQSNGRVPESLREINVEEKMEGPIYYQRETDSTYILYYGGTLGESIVLDTVSGKWESDGG
jgi:hypothetical protein